MWVNFDKLSDSKSTVDRKVYKLLIVCSKVCDFVANILSAMQQSDVVSRQNSFPWIEIELVDLTKNRRECPFFRKEEIDKNLIWYKVGFILNKHAWEKYWRDLSGQETISDIYTRDKIAWLCGLYAKWILFDASNVEMFIDAKSKLSDADVERLVDLCKAWVWFRTCEDIVRSVRLSDDHFQKVIILSGKFWIDFDSRDDIEKYRVFFDKLDMSDIGFLRLIDLCWSVTDEDIDNFHMLWKISELNGKGDAASLHMLDVDKSAKDLFYQCIEKAENWEQFKLLLSQLYEKIKNRYNLNNSKIDTNRGHISLLMKIIGDNRVSSMLKLKTVRSKLRDLFNESNAQITLFEKDILDGENQGKSQIICNELYKLLGADEEMMRIIKEIHDLQMDNKNMQLKCNDLSIKNSVMRWENKEFYCIYYFYERFVGDNDSGVDIAVISWVKTGNIWIDNELMNSDLTISVGPESGTQPEEIWVNEILDAFWIPYECGMELESLLFTPDKKYPPIFLPINFVRNSFSKLKHYYELWLNIDIYNIVLFANLDLVDDEIIKLCAFQKLWVRFDSVNIINDCLNCNVADEEAVNLLIVKRRKEKMIKFMEENWLNDSGKFNVWMLFMKLFNWIEEVDCLNEYFCRPNGEIKKEIEKFNLWLLYVKSVYWIENYSDLLDKFSQLENTIEEKNNFDKWLSDAKLRHWIENYSDLFVKLNSLKCR